METKLPKEKPKSLALRRNLERLQLELRDIIQGVQRNNGTWGLPRYGIGEELHDRTEANGPDSYKGYYSVFNYTNEEPVIETKISARGSKAELVMPEPLLAPFTINESAPNSSGEGFSCKVSDISQSNGIEDLMELQQAHQEETRMNFDSCSLRLNEIEKKIQLDDD